MEKYMKTFLQWAKENKYDLPAVDEHAAKRAMVRGQYPTAYGRAQYPDLYFTPITATAALDLKQAKQAHDKAPPDGAP